MARSIPTTPQTTDASIWLWFWLLTLSIPPRLIILGFWIFGSTLSDAFDSWVLPVAGFLVAPSTTVAYAFMWSITSESVSGWEWIVVAFGVLFDLWMWGALQRLRAH